MTQGPAFSETYPAHEEESPETALDLVRGIGGTAAGQEDFEEYGDPTIEDYLEPDDSEDPDEAETGPETGEIDDDESEQGDEAVMPMRRRAAERAGRTLKCYVRAPGTKDPEHNGRSHGRGHKQKKSRKRDDDRHRGGGGGEWWRRKVREAKATHGETCRCTLCMSPLL